MHFQRMPPFWKYEEDKDDEDIAHPHTAGRANDDGRRTRGDSRSARCRRMHDEAKRPELAKFRRRGRGALPRPWRSHIRVTPPPPTRRGDISTAGSTARR